MKIPTRLAIPTLLCLALATGAAREIRTVAGWQIGTPTPGTHRACLDLDGPLGGRGCGKIVSLAEADGARATFIQDFFGKTALKPGRAYRYRVSYRTAVPLPGHGQLLIDCYTAEGEKSHTALVSRRLEASGGWQTISGETRVPERVERVRMLLYLRGGGTIWYDDAELADAAPGSPNLLQNGGFEPPASIIYDLAPERRSGDVRFAADFENGALGAIKQIGPDEFYLHASPESGPRSPFLWFHFRVEGCQGREITFHINPTPFTKPKIDTGGNGTRLPVMSYDGDSWSGIEDKRWNEDGTTLTFKQRFERAPAWIASFFPFPPDHLSRFLAAQRADPGRARWLRVDPIGKTREGRDIRLLTITDPTVPDDSKRIVMLMSLQHDLETTGAMAIEGICRSLLSDRPRAAALRRGFLFHAVPIMNPDGIAQGNTYCPAGNMNRQWGLGTTAETTCVERFVKDLRARGRTIDLFLDLHGWCTPARTTLFLGHGKEITDAETEAALSRLIAAVTPRLSGKVSQRIYRKRIETVTGITGDLNRLSAGWMQLEGGARLALCMEIFGEGECTQPQYFDWGTAILDGIADFYGVP